MADVYASPLGTTVLQITSVPPPSAEVIAELSAELGEGCEYNDRPYAERGWCIAEQIFASDCLLRLPMPSVDQPKLVRLLDDGKGVRANPLLRDAKEAMAAMSAATFTRKGDVKTVLHMHRAFLHRLFLIADCSVTPSPPEIPYQRAETTSTPPADSAVVDGFGSHPTA
eukprot:CAMPEP_0115861102 /NCGR_PEP_ID=MMETSP0287-20121206/17480_1 /TAXON_ID=412157 /ORGANISM="Chrysochromulina rotalis, Strain UIO044" /LENGTH=168 /DNA_ID=CAMNT_0003315467 /DNA_START=161 /DNA_END=668 /DNA_ORIENTATION=-